MKRVGEKVSRKRVGTGRSSSPSSPVRERERITVKNLPSPTPKRKGSITHAYFYSELEGKYPREVKKGDIVEYKKRGAATTARWIVVHGSGGEKKGDPTVKVISLEDDSIISNPLVSKLVFVSRTADEELADEEQVDEVEADEQPAPKKPSAKRPRRSE